MNANHEYVPADPSLEFQESRTRNVELSNAPDVWGVVVRAKWILALGLIVGLAGGQALYMKLGPSFEAKAKILVSKRTTAPIKDADQASLGDRAEHVALIMSPLIVGEAVKKHQLDKLPSLDGEAEPAEEILDGLRVRRSAGQDRSVLNVIDIAYVSRKPGDATAVVEAVIDAYRNYLNSTRDEHSSESVKLIGQASRNLQAQLKEKENAYISFREDAPLYWKNAPGTEGASGDTTNVPQERMLAVEAERRINLLRSAEIGSKIKAIEQAIARGDSRQTLEILIRRFLNTEGGSGPTAVVDPAVTEMQSKLLPLILHEEKLLRDFGPDHPEVKLARRSQKTIREFYEKQGVVLPDSNPAAATGQPAEKKPATAKTPEGEQADFVDAYLKSLYQQLEELEIRDRALATLFDQASKQSKQYARYQVEDQALTGEIKRLKTLWEAIVNRLNELNIVKENQGFLLKEIAPAKEGVDAKRQMRIVGIAAVVGLALAFGLAYLRELQDNTLKTVEDVQRQYGMQVLGQVPRFKPSATKEVARSGSLLNPDLHYAYRPGSMEAEAYRAIRAALYFNLHGSHKVIQVTSPEPRDGKTTLISNLALAVAHSGKRVLLIDADLRCPKVHTMFGVSRVIGLSEVLGGELELAQVIRGTEIDGLSLICAGVSPASPAELLGSNRFAALIATVREQFDLVLVDAPPLLAVSDACVIATQMDGLLLLLRAGKTKRTVARRSHELLTTHGIPLLGSVVNGVGISLENGYGYAYTDQSSTGADPDDNLASPTGTSLSTTSA